ncbi:twin-arginine translocase TatA/TatE family subunit [Chloroflexus sp.]|uniref:twin-arginine translocase TatA/TatE family subunit n=1 Tax=Chloroflexus sp. TaxID=1904827 RepID=UPI002ADD5717|nr:twin-arginine translocase TatA/TatE family subunit [Chloroflexus sp.]
MEIFNVHLFEFILIAGLALVLFGPERLPELGRFAGKQVAKFLAWQQQSPELQMINEMRSEFEREIAQLRDELVRTRNQLDVRNDMQALADEVKAAGQQVQSALDEVKTAGQQVQSALDEVKTAGQQAQSVLDDVKTVGQQAQSVLDDAATTAKPVIRPPAQPIVPAATPAVASPSASAVVQTITEEDRALLAESAPAPAEPGTTSATPSPELQEQPVMSTAEDHVPAAEVPLLTPSDTAPALISADELRDLLNRLNSLAAELQAIVFQLQARGLLDEHWQPQIPASPATEETVTS